VFEPAASVDVGVVAVIRSTSGPNSATTPTMLLRELSRKSRRGGARRSAGTPSHSQPSQLQLEANGFEDLLMAHGAGSHHWASAPAKTLMVSRRSFTTRSGRGLSLGLSPIFHQEQPAGPPLTIDKAFLGIHDPMGTQQKIELVTRAHFPKGANEERGELGQ
jgi:hypothetical protein